MAIINSRSAIYKIHIPDSERDKIQYCRRFQFWISLFLLLLIMGIYWPVGSFEFTNFDDNIYVSDNLHVQAGLTKEGLIWAFQSTEAGLWHPLTWLSLMLDYEVYGLASGGYHVTNVIFHIGSTLLLFFVLFKATGALWRSAFVSALFAIHPLHVESVAWIAERKDVLSTFLWMLTMWLYVLYVRQKNVGIYALIIFVFILGLMAKPMLVTLPFILILMDYWPLNRIQLTTWRQTEWIQYQWLLWEKVPLLLLSGVFSVIAYYSQQKAQAIISIPLVFRIENAFISYVIYIRKMMWPFDLAVFYPYQMDLPIWQIISAFLIIALTTGFALWFVKRSPYLLFGWLWYLVTLCPVIGIIQVGEQAYADRYTYIPLIGLFIFISWGISDLYSRYKFNRIILTILAVVCLILFSLCTVSQLSHWRDSVSLFQHATMIVRDNYLCHYNLGIALKEKGDLDSAVSQYRLAIALNPENAAVHNNLAVALIAKGDFTDALNELRTVIRLKPDHAGAYNNIAMILYKQGNIHEAILYFRKALIIQPNYANAHFYLAASLEKQGNTQEAETHFAIAAHINPTFVKMKAELFSKDY